jgi:hypothetical protein
MSRLRCWLKGHEWMSLRDGAYRTCPRCCTVEVFRHDGEWSGLRAVNRDNWAGVVRRICLDGCDSLREHRAMLARRHG